MGQHTRWYYKDAKPETMKIGKKLRKYRAEAKLAQWQLAEKIGVSQSTICLIENDKMEVTLKTRMELAKALGKHPSDFIDYNSYKKMAIEQQPFISELTVEEDRSVRLNMPIETLTVSEEKDNDFCLNCIHREICNLRQAYNSLYQDVANLKTSDNFSIDVRCKHFRSKELTR